MDGRGEVVNRYRYDAFGNTVEAVEKVHNRFRYAGEQFDPVTGQYYLRARFYNPVIGRFTQEDTYRGDGLNLYAYVANNPVKYVDPSGYCGESKNGMQETDEPDTGVNNKGGSNPAGVNFEGTVYRNVGHNPKTGLPYNPLEMNQYTIDSNHRYTKKGVPGLYFGDSIDTVAAELGHYKINDLNNNRTTFSFDIKANNMLDITDNSVRKKLGISLESITGNSYEVTHKIGDMAYSNGYNGLIVPSARRKGGVNIVIFNPDNVEIKKK